MILSTVIDHNNAFDAGFNEAVFFEGHIFRTERDKVPAPFLLEQSQAFAKAAARFAELTGDLPDEWVEHHGSTGDFKPESAIEILCRSANYLTCSV